MAYPRAIRNPQFPTGRAVRVPSYAPTEAMPLEGYTIQGRIAGIQQSQQFLLFGRGQYRAFAMQATHPIGSGIQMGQMFSQPLTVFTDTKGG